jgi:hypothetical protein
VGARSLAAGTALAAVLAAAPALATPRVYSARPGRASARISFAATYRGSGSWATTYRSEPPNPGAKPDHNYAHDSSAEQWSLHYAAPVRLTACHFQEVSNPRPCRRVDAPSHATGTSSASGRISHVHIDGIYPADNASVSCRVDAQTPRGLLLFAGLSIRYRPARNAIAVTALDPVDTVLSLLPGECPGQGDPIDGIADNYFTPGFSFASAFGPDRWFRSRTVTVPLRVLRHSRQITFHFHQTAAGTPPRTCAVPDPSYQQCATGGSWNGVLTLTRQ